MLARLKKCTQFTKIYYILLISGEIPHQPYPYLGLHSIELGKLHLYLGKSFWEFFLNCFDLYYLMLIKHYTTFGLLYVIVCDVKKIHIAP